MHIYLRFLLVFLLITTSIESSIPVSKEKFDAALKEHIHWTEEGPQIIGHIMIEDHSTTINDATWLYVKRALDHYKETKPIFIILELNTPGGEVYAAQKISDALMELDIQYNIPVIAYINNWAISAGAMLTYSCRFIVTARDGSLGGAEPITAGQDGAMQPVSEKINSVLRADFANRARFFDRNPDIAEAMVDKDIILVLRDGKITRLEKEDQIVSGGSNPDVVITPKGKLLTLNAQQMIDYGVADTMLQSKKLTPITNEERESGKWLFSQTALSEYPFFKTIPNAQVDAFQMDWKMRFFVFLTTPAVASLLMLGLMLGFYMEMSSPGFGVAGTLATTCLVLILISNMALEITNWLEVVFVVVGLLMIAVELAFMHTGGLFAIIGGIFMMVGLFAMMLPNIHNIDFEFDTGTFNVAGEAFFYRLAFLCATLVVGGILIAIISRYVTPTLGRFSRLVLKGHEQKSSEGYYSGENPKSMPQKGERGEVFATLRPSGKVVINGAIYDAVTSGDFIEKGESVVVVALDGSALIVEKETR